MSQFAVYKSPLRDSQIAFVVQIQTNRFDRTKGRVVMSLMHRAGDRTPDHAITPHFMVLGVAVFANPLDISTIPTTRLGTPVAILPESDQSLLITAIDELISRA